MCNGSNKMGQLFIKSTSRWSGSTIDSLIGWSSGAVSPNGLRIHSIWTRPQIIITGGSWRETCMRTIYNLLLWPSIGRFLPYRKESVREIDNSLDEFKCVINKIQNILWARDIKSMFLIVVISASRTCNLFEFLFL